MGNLIGLKIQGHREKTQLELFREQSDVTALDRLVSRFDYHLRSRQRAVLCGLFAFLRHFLVSNRRASHRGSPECAIVRTEHRFKSHYNVLQA